MSNAIEYESKRDGDAHFYLLAVVIDGVEKYYAGLLTKRKPRLVDDKKDAKWFRYGRCFGLSQYMRDEGYDWKIVRAIDCDDELVNGVAG